MTDRSTFDAFERRLADELARYVAPAMDPKPATEIADAAMQPRGVIVRARNVSTRRRLIVLGLAAALLVPAVYVGAGGIRPAPAVPFTELVQPSQAVVPRPTITPRASSSPAHPAQSAVSIFLRRVTVPEPGVAVLAVGPDGAETLVRMVSDSLIAGGGELSEWGTVSESGWLALAVMQTPWPMVVVDLRDDQAAPWVVTEASTGGIGPRWGPTGLVAADAGGNGGSVVIADPATHVTQVISMHGGLIGGGPSIVWAADGLGIVGSMNGAFQVVPIDGSEPHPGVGDVYDPRGFFGPGLSGVRVCAEDPSCADAADGRVELVESDGSARTVWQQGADRALAAGFGSEPDEYWLATDHAKGSELALVRVQRGLVTTAATVRRDSSWQSVGAPVEAPDHSVALLPLDIGAKPAAVVVPLDGGPQTFHTGIFAGFVAKAAIDRSTSSHSPTPGQTAPADGVAYGLPALDELIAAELQLNPGERVIAKASHDAVPGDTESHDVTIRRDEAGGFLYFDCFGPSSAEVTVGSDSRTNPCLLLGSYGLEMDPRSPIVVTATGETSWRVVVYLPPAP